MHIVRLLFLLGFLLTSGCGIDVGLQLGGDDSPADTTPTFTPEFNISVNSTTMELENPATLKLSTSFALNTSAGSLSSLNAEKIELFSGTTKLAEDSTPPYEFEVSDLVGSFYDVYFRATVNGTTYDSSVTRIELTQYQNYKIDFTRDLSNVASSPTDAFINHGLKDYSSYYEADTGDVMSVKASGLEYGWDSPVSVGNFVINFGQFGYDSPAMVSLRLNSTSRSWGIKVPNGDYRVRAMASENDWRFSNGFVDIQIEGGTDLFNESTTRETYRILKDFASITVSDGQLDLDYTSGSNSGFVGINFIEIYPIPTVGSDRGGPSQTGAGVVHELYSDRARVGFPASEDNVGIDYYEFYLNNQLIKQHRIPEAFIDGLTPDTDYEIYAVAVDFSGNKSVNGVITNFTTPSDDRHRAQSTASAITIDGTIDSEWDTAVDNPFIGFLEDQIGAAFGGDSDLSAQAKYMWDSTYLYIGLSVTDDDNDSSDQIEINILADGPRTNRLGINAQQIFFSYGNATSGDNDLNRDFVVLSYSTAGGDFAFGDTGSGYDLEVRIPWNDISSGYTPTAGDEVYLEIQVKDRDGGVFEHQISLSERVIDEAWISPERYHTLILE